MTGPRAVMVTRLRVDPEGGGAEGVVLDVTGPSIAGWDWQVVSGSNRVRSIDRLAVPPPLATAGLAGSPWIALAAVGLPPEGLGSWWRVAFARPLTEPMELEGRFAAQVPAAGDEPWEVPLVRVASAGDADHRVTLDLRAAPRWRPTAVGLAGVPAADGSPRFRTYRYGGGPSTLTLLPNEGSTEPVLDRARLVTYATEPGRFVHRLSYRLWDWDRPTIPLDLPTGAAVRQVRVNGAVARPEVAEMSATAFHVEIPAPIDSGPIAVEIIYTTHRPPEVGLVNRLHAAGPPLPGGTGRLRHVWCLPAAESPLSVRDWRVVTEQYETVGRSDLVPPDIRRGTFWEAADETTDGDILWTAWPRETGLWGGALAVVALALAWCCRNWPSDRQWTGLIAWLMLAAAAAIWVPDPLAPLARGPLLAAVLVAGWKLVAGRPPRMPTGERLRPTSVIGVPTAILIAAWLLPVGRAAAPAPTLVYLVPGPAESPDPRTVLAPPDVLDRLRAVARSGPAGLAGAVWVDARYEAQTAGGQADVTAELRLHAFSDDPLSVPLPLSGVQLRDAKLDGGEALLRAAGDRYLLPVRGRGPHTLIVSFSVPASAQADDREVRFGVPEVVSNRLTLLAPAGATHVQPLSWRGAQRLDADGDRPRLEVDLGRVGVVHLRWRADDRPSRAAIVRPRETYLWDLTGSSARLLGGIRYAIGPGTVTNLTVDIPKDLEVANVAARPLDDPAAAAGGHPPPARGWLRAWHVSPPGPARRPLVLDFAAPISGAWLVTLELVPREPFPPTFNLPFPTAPGGQPAPPVFAWRSEGHSFVETRPAVATQMPPDVFLKDHWQPVRAESDARPPTEAYQRTAPGPAPAVRLRSAAATRERATTDVKWTVGPRRAEVEATARVAAERGRLSVVEWTVPPAVDLADVVGPDVHRWSRSGSLLQVWLARPAGEATLKVTGVVVRPGEAARFEVPVIRPRAVAEGGTLVVTAREGLTLTPVLATNLAESSPPPAGGREWSYATGAAAYRSAFQVRPAAGTTDFRVHTEATVRGGRLTSTSTIDATVRRGQLRSFTVTAGRDAGWQFQVSAPGGARVHEAPAGPGPRSWLIDLPPGVTAHYQATVTADAPPDAARDLPLPDVTVAVADARSDQVQRTVAVTGPDLHPLDVLGLRPLRDRPGWQVAADNWRMTLHFDRLRSPGREPVRLELTDVEVAPADDGRWARHATFWLVQNGDAELRATWLTPLRVVAIALDGQWSPPPEGSGRTATIPLATGTVARKLELVWTCAVEETPPAAPEIPTLSTDRGAVQGGPILWTVGFPTGSGPRPDREPLPPAARALYRAAAQVRLAAAARAASPAQAHAARVRAAAELRRADGLLADVADDPSGPNGITLSAWRDQLVQSLRPGDGSSAAAEGATVFPFDDAFAPGDRLTWMMTAAEEGPRLTWDVRGGSAGIKLLRLTVAAAVGVLAVLCGRRFGGRAWPEQLALLGAAAWVADGSVAWLIPIVVGVAARAWLLARSGLDRWRPRPAGSEVTPARLRAVE